MPCAVDRPQTLIKFIGETIMLRCRMTVAALIACTIGVAGTGCNDGAKLDGQLVLVERQTRDLKVTSVRPEAGGVNGGTLVVLTGEGFEPAMTVTFGGNPATQLYVGGDELAAMLTPASADAGAVDVVVTRNSDEQTASVADGFTYLKEGDVLVTEVLPAEGALAGGETVTVAGQGFADGAKVFFGANQATGIRVLGPEALTLTVPAGDAVGSVSVRVEVPSGATHTLDFGYSYLPDGPQSKLEVLAVIPSEGPLAGGNPITIEGKGFIDGATVKVGGAAATDVRVLGANAITCTAPAGAGPGLVDVRVENPLVDGSVTPSSAFLDSAYRYLPEAPSLLSVLAVIPGEGPLEGGNVAAVQGTGFVDGSKVYFDGRLGTQIQVLGPNALTARVPAATVAGPIEVRVELPGSGGVGGEAAALASGYTYLPGDPALLVLRAIPQSGPLDGGNVVALEGAGFRAGARVYFGGAPATQVQVLGPTAITCIAPQNNAPATVDLRVELPALAGQVSGEAYTLDNGYSYLLGGTGGAFGVASLFPTQDYEAGGALVFITGTGFDPAMVVRFGAAQSPLVQVLSGNAATALVPPGTAGLVDVTLVNPNNEQVVLTSGFRYVAEASVAGAPPALGAVSPGRGPTAGGTIVRIVGANFATDLRVFFGDTAATSVRVISPSVASAVVPAHAAGNVAVRVVNPDDAADSLAGAFVYADPTGAPSVTATWPPTGPSSGGTWVTLDGADFAVGTTVWFGMIPAATTTVLGTTRLVAVAPTAPVGSVDLTVVRPDGAFVTVTDAFAYYDVNTLPGEPPIIASVFPSVGDVIGGEDVSVIGSGFAAGARFYFGANEVAVQSVTADTQRVVLTAPHAPGTVKVTVVNPNGLTSSKSDAFVYFAPPPLIISVDPAVAAASGGSEITIRGKNFAAGAVVRLGASEISAFNTFSPTIIKFYAPAHAPATLDVKVLNPDGQLDTVSGGFVYLSDDQFSSPVVTSIEPTQGLASGGFLAIIHGDNFQPGATVTFGNIPAANVQQVTPTVITAIVPAGTANETVSVTVANSADKKGTLQGAFTYTSAPVGPIAIRSVAPGLGQMDGGTVITISGEGFEDGSAVLIDGVASPAVDVISSSVITAVTPAGEPGLVDVRVQRPDQTAATAFKAFAYYDPATFGDGPSVFSTDPVLGPLSGGTAVMLSGQQFAGPVQVFFGANEATSVTVLDAGRVVARTPSAQSSRTVAVSVINFDGLVGVLPGGFSYYDATGAIGPAVFTVLPFQGSVFGGEEVTIVGENLSAGTRVYICDRPAQVTSIVNSQQLKVRTPGGDVGPCRVTAVNSNGLTGNRDDAFTYVSPTPTVAEVIPRVGPIEGGLDVVVRGDQFVPGAAVRFGNAVSPKVVVADATTLTATLPPASLGKVDVTVINPGGAQGKLTLGFEYVDSVSGIPPTISAIVPGSGPLAGGTPVQIIGQNFDPDVLVLFNQQTMPSRVFVSTSEIRITTPPAGATGSVPITVLNPDGLGATVPIGFTYANPQSPPPEITSVVPATGREAGGTQITITGKYFDAGGTWSLGGKPLENIATVTSSLVTARTPPNIPGKVGLTYVGPDGQVAIRLLAFEYLAAPVLTSITPPLGGVAGGTEVTLIGDHFKQGMDVFFGSAVGQVLSVQSELTALARTPSVVQSGLVAVKVRNPDGQESLLANGFEFLDPPDATGVWPPRGPSPGGTLVTVSGTGFHAQSRVFFGANESPEVHFGGKTTLLAFAPAGTLGKVPVRVLNPDGREDTIAEAFTYTDPTTLGAAPFIGEVFPARGPTLGGTRVSLDGANYDPNARAFFLPNPAVIEANVGSRVIAVAPAHPSGPSQVWLVNPDGQTIRALVDYTYIDPALLGTPPIVGSVAPRQGPTEGGTEVTLIGTNFQQSARVRFGAHDATSTSTAAQQLRVLTPAHPAASATVWVVNPDGTQALAPSPFLFLPPPTVLAVNPNRSPADGGVSVTISGQNLHTDPLGELPDVLFCSDYIAGLDCASADVAFTTVNGPGTELYVIAPPHTPALVDVVVLAPDGQVDVADRAFTYNALPTIAGVTPASGPTKGTNTLTLTGTGFQQGAVVRINGALCAQVVVAGSASLSCVAPPGAAGPASVVVTNPDGGAVTKTAGYTYVPPPQLVSMLPNVGPEVGGGQATITGFNFSTGLQKPQVFIGVTEVAEANVTVNGTTSILIVVPPGAGSNDVRVINPDGQVGVLLDGFTYIPPLQPPSITFIAPPAGTTLGGEAVKIAGNHFLDGARVLFGHDPDWFEADSVEVTNNGTLIRCVTPAAPVAGVVDVRVVNSDTQDAVLASAFEYVPPATEADLAFLNIEPSRSILLGGGYATIGGQGFRQGIQVRFISPNGPAALATEVNRLGPTLLRVKIPPAPSGTHEVVTVRLVNPPSGGQSEFIDAVGAFEYVDGPVFVRDLGDRLPNEPQNDRGVLIFDANADGLNDVLVFTDAIDRLLINGHEGRKANFQTREFAKNYGGFDTVFAVAKDFDEDGDVDIVRHRSNGTVQFCQNTGGGEWPTCVDIAYFNCGMRRFVAEDLNCDGHLDLFLPFTSTSSSCQNRILIGRGDGSFVEAPPGTLPPLLEKTQGVAAADVDNDNDVDLLLANDDNVQNRLYLNNCANIQDTGTCSQGVPHFLNVNYDDHIYAFSRPVPSGVSGTGHVYNSNWDNSRAFCESWGLDLAVIETPAEDAFIRANNTTNYHLWLGLRDFDQTENWQWTNGSSATPGWCSSEPNTPSYDCALYQYSSSPTSYCVIDYPCSNGQYFVCEGPGHICDNPWQFVDSQYGEGKTFPVSAGNSRDVLLVDINDDDLPDAVVANWGQNVSVYLNIGGKFARDDFFHWPQNEANPYIDRLLYQDIDQDGDVDIIAEAQNFEIRVYANDLVQQGAPGGIGTMVNETSLRWPNGDGFDSRTDVYDFALGDLDQDNLPDVYLVGRSYTDRLVMNAGYEEGLPWIESSRVPAGQFRFNTFRRTPERFYDGRGAVLGDLDGVNGPDIVKCGWVEPLTIYFNDGAGKYVDVSEQVLPDEFWYWCVTGRAIKLVDIDDDGDLDILYEGENYPHSCSNGTGQPSGANCRDRLMLINDGFGNFINVAPVNQPYGGHTGASTLGVADFDHDGDLDWIAGSNYSTVTAWVYINGGDVWNVGGAYGFQSNSWLVDPNNNVTLPTYYNYDIAFVDLEGDVYPDIFLARHGQNLVLHNVAGKRFENVTVQWANTTDDTTYRLIPADMDNDGDEDVMVFNSGVNRYLFRQATDFANITASAFPTQISDDSRSGDVGDLDLDPAHFSDFIVANYNQQNRMYVNLGGTEFLDLTENMPWDQMRSYDTFLFDVDNDGDLDIYWSNEDQDRIYINTIIP
ncbi:MAG: hypothetical protein CVU56_23360 [Deltaproteobacteria bacterium HGW-Deltaproteobacteria-14]|jgi:hypothetical protein|nr:MAG: hypothetical protein CVU56_23360 [Deltaproteobacteria bacterium HGW-Deltaproteobacteria-14]